MSLKLTHRIHVWYVYPTFAIKINQVLGTGKYIYILYYTIHGSYGKKTGGPSLPVPFPLARWWKVLFQLCRFRPGPVLMRIGDIGTQPISIKWIPSTARRGPWGYQVTPFWLVCRGILLEGIQMVNPSWVLHTFLLPRDPPINGWVARGPQQISRFLRVPCFTSRYTHVQACIHKNPKSKIRYSGPTNTIPRNKKNIIQHSGSIYTHNPPNQKKGKEMHVLGELWWLTLGFQTPLSSGLGKCHQTRFYNLRFPGYVAGWSFYPKTG